jgi:hypothetical protein
MTLNYQPSEQFSSSLRLCYNDLYRTSDSQKEYEYLILRSTNTFRVNKYLFLRGIVEYNSFYDNILMPEFLASFKYIPGMVIYIGYSSVLENKANTINMAEYHPEQRFRKAPRSFLFKVSYLWRL